MNERQRIFGPYHDGTAEVFADPFHVFLALVCLLDGDPESVNREAKAVPLAEGMPAEDHAGWRLSVAEAQQKLAHAAREAFAMTPFDKVTGCGATDEQCQMVLDQFLEYMDQLKKNAASTLTSPVLTAAPSLLVPGLSPAMTDSDCGCS